jgi:O-antigen ligase
LYHVENGLLLIAQNPIFGIGPSKSLYEDMGSLDNEYITILFRYGLVGLIATAAFVRVLAFGAIKQKAAFYRTMRNLAGALLVAIALFAYTAASYGNFRIMFLIIIISALPASVKLLPSQRPNAA